MYRSVKLGWGVPYSTQAARHVLVDSADAQPGTGWYGVKRCKGGRDFSSPGNASLSIVTAYILQGTFRIRNKLDERTELKLKTLLQIRRLNHQM